MTVWHRIRTPWPSLFGDVFSIGLIPQGECSVPAYVCEFSNTEYPWLDPKRHVRCYVLHEDHHGVFPLGIKKIQRAARRYAYEHQLNFLYVSAGHANSNRHPVRRGFDRNGHVCCESTWAGWYCYTCGAQN